MLGSMGIGTSGSTSGTKQPVSGEAFYRFQDAHGRIHIVDSLDLVPERLKARAERVQYDEQATVSSLPHGGLPQLQKISGWQAFALGIAAALLVGFLARRLPGSLRVALRLGVVASVVALLAGAYFGWLRRTTQKSGDALGTPAALLEDAKSAVDKMNARIRAQEAELHEAEQAK